MPIKFYLKIHIVHAPSRQFKWRAIRHLARMFAVNECNTHPRRVTEIEYSHVIMRATIVSYKTEESKVAKRTKFS